MEEVVMVEEDSEEPALAQDWGGSLCKDRRQADAQHGSVKRPTGKDGRAGKE